MKNFDELIDNLTSSDNTEAYNALKELTDISLASPNIYRFFDLFAKMMNDKNSFVRTRGITLICANAEWDSENKINNIIGSILEHVKDEKPITARQCIKALPNIIKFKPELKNQIKHSLLNADTSVYNSNMQPLVDKDIQSVLKKIEKE